MNIPIIMIKMIVTILIWHECSIIPKLFTILWIIPLIKSQCSTRMFSRELKAAFIIWTFTYCSTSWAVFLKRGTTALRKPLKNVQGVMSLNKNTEMYTQHFFYKNLWVNLLQCRSTSLLCNVILLSIFGYCVGILCVCVCPSPSHSAGITVGDWALPSDYTDSSSSELKHV